ncbi:segregation/condensation protein A [Candidatus Woesearchaeota archaeon]|nr:MAG: segregation/condensation protein A [Candidatus Woesearchaeota archaeon]
MFSRGALLNGKSYKPKMSFSLCHGSISTVAKRGAWFFRSNLINDKKTRRDTMQDQILDILLKEDEITWQSMLLELVKKEDMDPWDIDISLLAKRFLEMVHKMKELNLHVSGKVLLASAILLKMKSTRLLEYDINEFDSLLASSQQSEEEFLSELEDLGEGFYEGGGISGEPSLDRVQLIPRMPQPRKRKVSIYDLVDALEKALEVEARRPPKPAPGPKVSIPKKSFDVSTVMRSLYKKIVEYLGGQEQKAIKFSKLIPSESKEDKVYTLIPLLHLTNQRKVDLEQERPFTDFDVILLDAVNPPEEEKMES